MAFFCGDHRKSVLQIKTHLVTKNTSGTCTGTVAFINPGFNNML